MTISGWASPCAPRQRPDLERLASLRTALWPEGSRDEHRAELLDILAGRPRSTLPLVVFVADVAGEIAGFVEVGVRSHADGCDPVRPVGFIEGWYVAPPHRRRGLGRALIAAAEAWCRALGCREVASDTWIENTDSQRAHEALGYDVADRCVNYRKRLVG